MTSSNLRLSSHLYHLFFILFPFPHTLWIFPRFSLPDEAIIPSLLLKVGTCTASLGQAVPKAAFHPSGFSPAGEVLPSQDRRHLLSQPGAAALGQKPQGHFHSVPQLQTCFRWTTEKIICLGISWGEIRIFFWKTNKQKLIFVWFDLIRTSSTNCYITLLCSYVIFMYLFMS